MKVNGRPRSFGSARFSLTMTLKFNTETRLRLRKKLNKNLDDIIDGESEIVKAISNVPSNKEVKKYRMAGAQLECALEAKMLKEEEDKKTWLIKF